MLPWTRQSRERCLFQEKVCPAPIMATWCHARPACSQSMHRLKPEHPEHLTPPKAVRLQSLHTPSHMTSVKRQERRKERKKRRRTGMRWDTMANMMDGLKRQLGNCLHYQTSFGEYGYWSCSGVAKPHTRDSGLLLRHPKHGRSYGSGGVVVRDCLWVESGGGFPVPWRVIFWWWFVWFFFLFLFLIVVYHEIVIIILFLLGRCGSFGTRGGPGGCLLVRIEWWDSRCCDGSTRISPYDLEHHSNRMFTPSSLINY